MIVAVYSTTTGFGVGSQEIKMRVILFGATGMIGQGVLRECLLNPLVEQVLMVGRRATGQRHEKLQELVRTDFLDFSDVAEKLSGYDACFFCLGVSSVGMKEADYQRVTYDITIAAARVLSERNPEMTFVYVSGRGTDSTEQGRVMWARVKGKTENALLQLPFRATYMFRPGYVQPLHGVQSKTAWYRWVYTAVGTLYPTLERVWPDWVTTTERIGVAMIRVAAGEKAPTVLENREINVLGVA